MKFRKAETTFTNSDQLKQNLCDIDELRTDAATPSPENSVEQIASKYRFTKQRWQWHLHK